MQTAGQGLVGAIAHVNRLGAELIPRELVHVIVKRHRLSHDLEAIVNTAIRLNIDKLVRVVDKIEQSFCIFLIMAAAVYFKLYAEKTLALAVKDRIRFVVVAVNVAVLFLIAIITIARIIGVIGIAGADDPVATIAAGIVILKARLTEEVVLVRVGVARVDQLLASVTAATFVIHAGLAQDVITDQIIVIILDDTAAAVADSQILLQFLLFFFHGCPPS